MRAAPDARARPPRPGGPGLTAPPPVPAPRRRTPALLLERAFKSLGEEDIGVKLISKGEKPNVAIVVADDAAVRGLKCLHRIFFER